MIALEEKIRKFSEDPENSITLWALLKVGVERGEATDKIAQVVIGDVLLRFHGIPVGDRQNS